MFPIAVHMTTSSNPDFVTECAIKITEIHTKMAAGAILCILPG